MPQPQHPLPSGLHAEAANVHEQQRSHWGAGRAAAAVVGLRANRTAETQPASTVLPAGEQDNGNFHTTGIDEYTQPRNSDDFGRLGSIRYVLFSVKMSSDREGAPGSAHLGFFTQEFANKRPLGTAAYDFCFGSSASTISKSGQQRAEGGASLKTLDVHRLWASVDLQTGRVAAGTGRDISSGASTEFVDEAVEPKFFAVRTTQGCAGNWRFQAENGGSMPSSPSSPTVRRTKMPAMPTTMDELRRECAALRQRAIRLEAENFDLSRQANEWQKWYTHSYRPMIAYWDNKITRLCQSAPVRPDPKSSHLLLGAPPSRAPPVSVVKRSTSEVHLPRIGSPATLGSGAKQRC